MSTIFKTSECCTKCFCCEFISPVTTQRTRVASCAPDFRSILETHVDLIDKFHKKKIPLLPKSNSTKLRPVGAALKHTDGQTDITSLICGFCDYDNATKTTVNISNPKTDSVSRRKYVKSHYNNLERREELPAVSVRGCLFTRVR